MLGKRFNFLQLGRHETGTFCLDAVYRAQDKLAAKRLRQFPEAYTGVYTYEDGALETLATAKEFGHKRIYDLPIAYWQTLRPLLAAEAERLPEWKITLGGGLEDSEGKLERKTKELELAELVICPSQFVATSVPKNVRTNKTIVVAPFGSPSLGSGKIAGCTTGSKLRVLFAGSMSQRKGLGDLFAAMRLLNRNDVELVVLGSPQAPLEFYREAFGGFVFEAERSHAKVLELMRSCDVFCLPSIVEGRALVMQEAMSQGLPLIITPNTGGEDLIVEEITGFLVPIRRPDEIASRIAWFAENRTALPDMSRAAQAKARRLTWETYGQTLADSILHLARN
jgi:glycosyltransferase involved in cell wall biosynthesis